MATAAENRVLLAAGPVQGVTLVTFPAASSVLTGPEEYGLTSSRYGAMFLPQVVTATTASLPGSRLSRALTAKRVLLATALLGLVDCSHPRTRGLTQEDP